MKKLFRPLVRFLSWFEIKPGMTVRAVTRYPGYLAEKRSFKAESTWEVRSFPCLFDKGVESAALGEYFWQDIFIAKKVLEAAPEHHVDVGSRVDGFIAHVACTRAVEVYDIRPLETEIPNVTFTQMDICNADPALLGISDFVTCLHSIEHFGLGRYGDTLDPQAWKRGIKGLHDLLTTDGSLWLSAPVGRERVEFNAHRIFAPNTIIDHASATGLVLREFLYLEGATTHSIEPQSAEFGEVSEMEYALGIFHFGRIQRVVE